METRISTVYMENVIRIHFSALLTAMKHFFKDSFRTAAVEFELLGINTLKRNGLSN